MNVSVLTGFLVLCVGVVAVHSANCPNGWSAHEEFCFLFKKETYTWFDAKMVCASLGGYLAEDTSSSRHEFMKGLLQTNGVLGAFAWIGLQDFAEENVFVWDRSGLRAEQTFWAPTEPQDRHGEEDCVMLHNGLWDDLNCEDSHPHFICEKPASDDDIVG